LFLGVGGDGAGVAIERVALAQQQRERLLTAGVTIGRMSA